MNDLQVFNNPEFGKIRTMMIDGEPWAVGKDVAVALGYKDAYNALKAHVDLEDKQNWQNASFKSPRGMTVINESGIYSLILSSKLPSAKRFKRWVTGEVLPALRRTGKYETATQQAEHRALTPDDYLRAANIIGSCRNERLPLVLNMLTRGGFTVPLLEDVDITKPAKDIMGRTAIAINDAVTIHGISCTKIGKLTGLPTATITRIRAGSQIPSLGRSSLICDAIRKEIERRTIEAE